ncbi:restriction endonuclease, partial [Promineifilum sp.]|uniref:restriction endonuclease n=1 Tax=Promineifilum sp. TaxID=2664178 RepID=UPI0035B31CCF
DVVLDPFCGCGTTIHAAQKLGRRWIGIDITHLSIALLKYRLKDAFPDLTYDVIGEPEDLDGARALARDNRYQFQWWALSLVRAQPLGGETGARTGKKGADRGIDGVITFVDDAGGKVKRVIVQVKSGKVGSPAVRDLVGVLNREGAAIAVFVTLEEPTKEMATEAAAAGFYRSEQWGRDYPRLQLLTVRELLAGAAVQMPPTAQTFKQARREKDAGPQQGRLEL